jgi:hypothetical protein
MAASRNHRPNRPHERISGRPSPTSCCVLDLLPSSCPTTITACPHLFRMLEREYAVCRLVNELNRAEHGWQSSLQVRFDRCGMYPHVPGIQPVVAIAGSSA